MNRRQALAALLAPAVPRLGAASPDSDWPQWRGPDRTGISKDTGLLKTWPMDGPKVVWSASGLGAGYASMAMAGNRVYTQGMDGGRSWVFALDRATGKPVWKVPIGRGLDQDRGDGPRGTPTIDGDTLFALAESGDLAALKTADGSTIWKLNILKEFGGQNPHWLLSESPLVDGRNLIVTPGGSGAGMVALDKANGKTVWTSKELSDTAGYSSCIAATVGGVRAYMTITSNAGVGVRASDGKLLWRYEPAANRTANVATPVFHDNKVFYTSAYGTGCGLVGLRPQNGEIKADEIYFSRDMQNHHGGVVLLKGYLYGFSNAILTCMEFATGKVAWRDRSVGKGTVTFADGQLYLLSENNVVGLADATHEGYRERSRFRIADQGKPSWAHIAVSGGRLYIRNQGTMTVYDVKAA
jgi:outer membrane protein assembly factor BamB